MTFACAQNEGFRVKRGEKGEPILKFCPYYLPDDEGKKKGMKYASEDDYLKMDDETKAYYHKVAKTVGYTVFNLDQTTIQAENFSKINDKRRTEPEKKGKSKSGGYKKSNTAVARKTTKKYGR